MAEEPKSANAAPSKGSILKPLIWSSIGFLLGAIGFAIPLLVPSLLGGDSTEEVVETPPEAVKPAFVEFGKTVVNLGDSANRYLSIMTTLQIDEPDTITMTAEVERMKPILQSWLLNHCSDKTMEDIRGAAGQHQLRREILDHFNEVLCPDGQDKIRDVLFLEFNVQ